MVQSVNYKPNRRSPLRDTLLREATDAIRKAKQELAAPKSLPPLTRQERLMLTVHLHAAYKPRQPMVYAFQRRSFGARVLRALFGVAS